MPLGSVGVGGASESAPWEAAEKVRRQQRRRREGGGGCGREVGGGRQG